jgi:type IV pilus assembly protein PilW
MDNDTGVALASAVNFDRIRAVRVWILARTRQPLRDHSGPKNFIVGDKPVNRNDKFKYRLLSTTIKCRNMGI